MKRTILQDKPRVVLQGTTRKRYRYIDIDLWNCDYNLSERGEAVWSAFMRSYWLGLLRYAQRRGDISKIGAAVLQGKTAAGWFQVRSGDAPSILALLNRLIAQPWATSPVGWNDTTPTN